MTVNERYNEIYNNLLNYNPKKELLTEDLERIAKPSYKGPLGWFKRLVHKLERPNPQTDKRQVAIIINACFKDVGFQEFLETKGKQTITGRRRLVKIENNLKALQKSFTRGGLSNDNLKASITAANNCFKNVMPPTPEVVVEDDKFKITLPHLGLQNGSPNADFENKLFTYWNNTFQENVFIQSLENELKTATPEEKDLISQAVNRFFTLYPERSANLFKDLQNLQRRFKVDFNSALNTSREFIERDFQQANESFINEASQVLEVQQTEL